MRTLLDTRPEALPARTPTENMKALEVLIPEVCDPIDIPSVTNHDFCDGIYRRQYSMKADDIVVSKTHKKDNYFLLFSGEVSIADGDGNVVRVSAPYMMITRPGTKRVVYCHKDCEIFTFHGNDDNEQDLDKLEEKYVIPEAPATIEDLRGAMQMIEYFGETL